DAGGDGRCHLYALVDSGDDGEVIHVGGRSHDRCVGFRQIDLGTHGIVIRSKPGPGDDVVSLGVGGALAALMIHQPADMIRAAAVPPRRAENTMRLHQLGHHVAARTPQLERRTPQQRLPLHQATVPFNAGRPSRSMWRTCASNQSASLSYVARFGWSGGETPKISLHTAALSNAP